MKQVAIALLTVVALSATSYAGLIDGTLDRISVAQEFGVGVPMNDDFFQDDWKPAIYGSPRVELYLGKSISVYAKYTFQTFDVVAGADSSADPIDASKWAYGAMVQGDLNTSGSVVGYLELGAQKSVSETEPNEFQFWQGLASRFYCTSARSTFIDLGLRYKPLGDTPLVEELAPRVAFGIGL